MQKFKDIIKDDDDFEYGDNRNNKKRMTIFKGSLNREDDDEDLDYI